MHFCKVLWQTVRSDTKPDNVNGGAMAQRVQDGGSLLALAVGHGFKWWWFTMVVTWWKVVSDGLGLAAVGLTVVRGGAQVEVKFVGARE